MQKDSPGKLIKSRNERYGTAAQPKLLSLSSAKKKAAEFAAKDNKTARVGAKKAILQELNSHLAIRARGLFPKEESENPYGKQHTDQKDFTQPRRASQKTRARTEKGKDKAVVQKERTSRKQSKALDYDWNKDGREQELRIRCLARKFLFLWMRNVYGRVHPYAARTHYTNKVKHHVLQTWQDIWWSGRKGWKLNIRAEYHDRYRTWLKVWRAWRLYVMQQKVKKHKEHKAVQHAKRKLQEKQFKAWTKYIKIRRVKSKKVEMACQLAVISVRRLAFQQWMKELEKRREHRTMECEAMQYWAYSLMRKCWSCWTSALSVHLIDKAKLSHAEKIANRKLLVKLWTGWKNYRAARKLKEIKKRVADRHYNTSLASRTLLTWNARLHRKQELAQFEDLIKYKGVIATARRALVHWKFYIILQHQKYTRQSLAIAQYESHLKKKVLDALHFQVAQRRLKNMRNEMSKDFWYKLQLKRTWRIWLKRCEHSEELKIYPLTRKARRHYRLKLLQKVIHSLQKYHSWRQHRRWQYYEADKHYRYHALPRYFRRIVVFVRIMKDMKESKLRADQFRREVLLAQTFYKWHHEYVLTLDLQMMNRMAILHHDEVTKRHYLAIWLNRTRKQLQEHEFQAKADDHNSYRLSYSAFQEWKKFTVNAKISRSHQHTAVRHHYLCILQKIWTSWTKYVQQRQRKWNLQAIADLHYQHTISRRLLQSWKTYSARSLQALSFANQRLKEHKSKRLRELFSTWYHFTVEHKNDRLSHDQAVLLYQTTIKKKVFIVWRQYAYLHAVKAEEKFIVIQEKHAILNQGKVRRAVRAWFVVTQESRNKRKQNMRSDQHYRKVLLVKSLDRWKSYVRLCFRIKILCRQSMWLHNHRITSAFLRRWKLQFAASLETKRKTSLSLWHWSVNLQRRAFHGWLIYAISKKQKQERVAQALQLRRTRLLKTGVTQWIKVAFDLRSERSRYSQVRHMEHARSLHQYVYKCAMHWRTWTSRRVTQRGRRQSRVSIRREAPTKPDVELLQGASRRTTSGNFPDLFKPRPKPRVPDYLRDSFDVSSFGMDDAKAPLSSLTFNLLPMAGADDNTRRNMGLEEMPRPAPPAPCPKRTVHPLRRTPGQDSIVFLPSSEGEGESFIVRNKRKEESGTTDTRQLLATTQMKHRPVQIDAPVLLPPSSFQSRRQTAEQEQKPVRDKRVMISNTGEKPPDHSSPNTSKDSFSPETSDDSYDHSNASSPGSTDGEEHQISRPRKWDLDLQAHILDARKKLQEYYDLKLQYRTVKRQRDELQKEILNEGENSLRDADKQNLLAQLSEETHELFTKIQKKRPLVEDVAININKMIEKIE